MIEPVAADASDVTERLLDLVYTGVGLGILAMNRAQVARRSVESQLGAGGAAAPLEALAALLDDPDRTRRLLDALRDEIDLLDDRLGGIEGHLGQVLDRVEPDLPSGAREIVVAVRTIVTDHSAQVRSLLGLKAR